MRGVFSIVVVICLASQAAAYDQHGEAIYIASLGQTLVAYDRDNGDETTTRYFIGQYGSMFEYTGQWFDQPYDYANAFVGVGGVYDHSWRPGFEDLEAIYLAWSGGDYQPDFYYYSPGGGDGGGDGGGGADTLNAMLGVDPAGIVSDLVDWMTTDLAGLVPLLFALLVIIWACGWLRLVYFAASEQRQADQAGVDLGQWRNQQADGVRWNKFEPWENQ